MKQNQAPAETLKRGMGTAMERNMLFAAMASALGFEARYAKLPDRGNIFFDRRVADGYFLRAYDVAVKLNDQWRFYDVNTANLPAGMLRWQEEGVDALISDPKNPVFVRTPMSPPDKSRRIRRANLTLAEDGSLEGDVVLQFTGHIAAASRVTVPQESAEKRETEVRKMVAAQYSSATVTDIKIENLDDVEQPLKYSYHVKIDGFAQRTGKRLFVQPSFFQLGAAVVFPISERKHQVYFHFPWREDDTVIIQLPPGYALDHPDAPAPLNFGKPGQYNVSITLNPDRQLIYRRSLIFGLADSVLFPVEVYPTLKKIFDNIHERDNHAVTLKQADPS